MTNNFKVFPGVYNVTEADYANWTLIDSECAIWDVYENQTKKTIDPIRIENTTQNFNLNPFEIAECTFTNHHPTGYITGGGKVNLDENLFPSHHQSINNEFVESVTHGFELHCDTNSGPNNFEVNWLGHKFHLEELEVANCYDDGSVNEPPPNGNGSKKPTLDIYHGEGYGRFDGVCDAYAEWTIDDNGEPGKADQIIALRIHDSLGNLVLDINPDDLNITNSSKSGVWYNGYPGDGEPWLDLESGNHQWTPHPQKSHGPKNTNPCAPVTP